MLNVLYDGDIFLYAACKAVEQVFTWEEHLHSVVSDSEEARMKMESDIDAVHKTIQNWLGKKLNIVVCFSGADNWRKNVLESYKAKRIGSIKPLAYRPVRDWFMKNYDCRIEYGLEADDIMGIESTTSQDDCIIVSEDKDLKGVPGWLFNPAKDSKPYLIEKHAADYFHMYQALMGDLVDGYSGCPGIGPISACSVLGDVELKQTEEQLWEKVVSAYRKAKLGLEVAQVQATVARILRVGEWDAKKEICLWTPPSIKTTAPAAPDTIRVESPVSVTVGSSTTPVNRDLGSSRRKRSGKSVKS